MSVSLAELSHSWRAVLTAQVPASPERGLERVWLAGMGLVERVRRRRGAYLALARAALAGQAELGMLSEEELAERSASARRALLRDDRAAGLRAAILAIVGEHARRSLALQPYAEQLAGAAALLDGCAIEMATGEGKSLVAALAAVVRGWKGRGCHVITANDYLVQRDAEWMGPLYRACDVRVGYVKDGMNGDDRREAYACDVTYGTSKEVAADYLRDRLALRASGRGAGAVMQALGKGRGVRASLLQRGLECAIVDEADSILIDEAVTPLLLSVDVANREASRSAEAAAALAETMREGEHYTVDRKFREVRLKDPARELVVARARGSGGLWKGPRRAEEEVVQALTARELYHRGRQYVVQEGRVQIVDEFTGRLMPDRTWRGGLHQAVEAKERLEVRPMKDTLARISFQRFFRSYRVLAGMTGTARGCRTELWSVYRLPVVAIPTHRPCVRLRPPNVNTRRSEERWSRLIDEIQRLHGEGRPVLVGTRTVEASERLSAALGSRGVAHHVLNAVRHAQESEIIARAGSIGVVTIATNMAGRGTDIRLGPGAAEVGGLHVLVSEAHEAARIDQQFFGRAGRQGDPGSARLFASLEDELVVRYAPFLAGLLRWTPAPGMARSLVVRLAQRRAQARALRRRLALLREDESLDTGLGFAGDEST